MKKFLTLIIMTLLMLCCTMTVFAAEDKQRVYDKAGIFSAEEINALEKELNKTVDELGMDFVVVTVSDKEGATIEAYADDFYDYGGFGTDDERSGLLMLIDMEDRLVRLSTTGKAAKYITDKRTEDLIYNNDEMLEYLTDGNYPAAVDNVIDGVENYVEQGIPGEKKLTFFEILLSVVISGLVAFLYINSINKQYAMKAEKANAVNYITAYRASSTFAFAVNTDDMISHNVTTRIIPKSSGSSGPKDSGTTTMHRSSSGTLHGGGTSRHF